MRDYITASERITLSKRDTAYLSSQMLLDEENRLRELYFEFEALSKKEKDIKKNIKMLTKTSRWI